MSEDRFYRDGMAYLELFLKCGLKHAIFLPQEYAYSLVAEFRKFQDDLAKGRVDGSKLQFEIETSNDFGRIAMSFLSADVIGISAAAWPCEDKRQEMEVKARELAVRGRIVELQNKELDEKERYDTGN